jgi:lactoylglutathione lyase
MPPSSFTTLPQGPPGAFLPGGPTATFNPPLSPNTTTTGYRLNHLAIRVREPSRSLHFYVDLLGMRVVFSMNAGPFTIYYLGHPPPGTESSKELGEWAEQTSQIPVMTRTAGLLELYHVHGTEGKEDGEVSTGNQPPNLGFAHLGFTVPDTKAAVERLRAAGVPILKDVGVSSREAVPLSEWEAAKGVGTGEIHENYARFFEKFAMIADPVSLRRDLGAFGRG